MPRRGYTIDHIHNDGDLTIVMGRNDRSTNPAYQYPVHAELVLDGWVVKLGIPTKFGWDCQVPGLQNGKTWYMGKVREWFLANLQHARTVYRIGPKGIKIPARGQDCPAVLERQAKISAEKQRQHQLALEQHQARNKALQAEAKANADAFYTKLKTASTYAGWGGLEAIESVVGEGPEAVVTLRSQKTGKRRVVEAKWLEAGGAKSLA